MSFVSDADLLPTGTLLPRVRPCGRQPRSILEAGLASLDLRRMRRAVALRFPAEGADRSDARSPSVADESRRDRLDARLHVWRAIIEVGMDTALRGARFLSSARLLPDPPGRPDSGRETGRAEMKRRRESPGGFR